WFKSSYSENGGACIEVAANLAATRGVVPVRESKNPGGPVQNASTPKIPSFVAGDKARQFGADLQTSTGPRPPGDHHQRPAPGGGPVAADPGHR
ncbi:DUF397 domain-containing protein, partial [Streptomyces sp. JV184]|uniref:DUF397 domain-containing protein n=1 Tax=Streptomyces sp. JV184 TaxID=858637 RepID=UPI003FA70263